MWKKRRIQGLIAASLYEPLSPPEQAEVEAYLASHPSMQREYAALQRTANAIPQSEAELTGDLWPALQAQLRESAPPRMIWGRLLAPAGLCALILVLCLTPFFRSRNPIAPQSEYIAVSPVAEAMAQAQVRASQDFPGAIAQLEQVLQAHPNDVHAFAAQVLLADLEFAHGQRYAQAFAAYERARQRYPEQWGRDPQQVIRFNLLEEARSADFESIYQLNAAMGPSERSLNRLEQVMASYPGTLVAMHAADAMLESIRQDDPNLSMAAVIEQARDCCTEPAAVAQLTMALGDFCWRNLGDAPRAKAAYQSVQESGPAMLAQLAEENLFEMESAPMANP